MATPPAQSGSQFAYLTKRCRISASHRLHSNALSAEENRSIYGKCNNPNGHGHNYNISVTLYGPIDPKTGMVYNISDLKQIMSATIMNTMDHKNLDKDVEYFGDGKVPSTAENIAVFIWSLLKEKLSRPELLHEVVIYETEDNIVSYRG